jgi:hypothetical protein
MIEPNIDRPFKFLVLTNDMDSDVPGELIPLKWNYPGWWSKIELHRPDLPCGRTLYMDLDTTIVGSLQPILDFPGDLVMFRNRMKGRQRINTEGKMVIPRYQAGTMLFTPGVTSGTVLKAFRSAPKLYMDNYRSEQDLMGELIPKQPTFPDEWLVKLSEVKGKKKISKKAIILAGQPREGDYREEHKRFVKCNH